MNLAVNKIPTAIRSLPQWVLWKYVVKSAGTDPTKVPFQTNDQPAKADDPATWSTFDPVLARYEHGGYDGIGFEFSESDPFCGVDLDGCRNPDTGEVQP